MPPTSAAWLRPGIARERRSLSQICNVYDMLSEKARTTRVAAVVVTLIVSAVIPALPAEAEHTGVAAERAALEILEARDRANEAAQAMFDAESKLDSLTIELAAAERGLAALEAEVGELRAGLTESAIRQYVGAGQNTLMLFQDIGRDDDQAQALVYAGAANGSQLVRADDYEEAIRELDDARQALERQRDETTAARQTWAALKTAAEDQVLELQRIEEERLADAAVQHELERQRQARAEQERRERERKAAIEAETPSNVAGGSAGTGNSSSTGSSTGGSPASATPTPPPAPAPAADAGAGMVCPVAGPRSFADTWGASRSGGRSHEGVDMMAPSGTPLVAAESGSATFKTNRLGGNAVWLTGASGTKYYYAHLSAWEGSSRSVSQGEVIGYVGKTGNTSVDHLHFEVHPNGGRAVNPYPYVRASC